jgi:hypothetical protein
MIQNKPQVYVGRGQTLIASKARDVPAAGVVTIPSDAFLSASEFLDIMDSLGKVPGQK